MADILIYSDIGESMWDEGITAASIKSQLVGDVTVRINSPGGDVFEGFAIYNLLKAHEGQVTVKIDGLAASAASIIAMAGDTVEAPETSMLMIHDPWTMAMGGSAELMEVAALLEQIKSAIIPAYTEKTGLSVQEISDMMTAETWLTGAQAAEMGFVNAIDKPAAKINNLNKIWIRNAPQIPDELQEQKEPEKEPETETHWRSALAARRLSLIE